jgi:hypothetical protein
MNRIARRAAGACLALLFMSERVAAQDAPPDHMHMQMDMDMSSGWHFMQDGVLFGVFNHQGGPRGATEFKAPNWWMGQASHGVGSSRLTLNAMLSLDAATEGRNGYAELFQVGESLDGRPLIDRQHPHDLFMQLAAIWRLPVGEDSGITLAGGPVGEPALGPVAFMHRASIAEYPFAPLSHHTFDSTHIAFGVVTVAFDHGPFVLEGSIFNGREPDDNRWDFDFGALDSYSGRLWFKPADRWEFQVSTGHLTHPEALEEGNVQRTTASGSWFARAGADYTAVTAGYGINVSGHGNRQAVFMEATARRESTAVFGRAEVLQVETALLLQDAIPPSQDEAAATDVVGAFTVGAERDVVSWRGLSGGVGAAVTVYAVPPALKSAYTDNPVSFQVFFRLRPPAGAMGRMWNMRMAGN